MTYPFETMLPADIERRSFEMIAQELDAQGVRLDEETDLIVRRVIHTTADFDYAQNLVFSPGAIEAGRAALSAGVPVVTDTQMARAGINKKALRDSVGRRCALCLTKMLPKPRVQTVQHVRLLAWIRRVR